MMPVSILNKEEDRAGVNPVQSVLDELGPRPVTKSAPSILWINEHADLKGGCETYAYHSASMLRQAGYRCTLMYDMSTPSSKRFLDAFDGAFPIVDVQEQVRQLSPDLIYIHRLSDMSILAELSCCGVPTLRFFHDYQLFCLREHKYTTIGQHTCSKPIGRHCYACLGFINRTDSWSRVKLTTLGDLRKQQAVNRRLSAFAVGSRYMARHVAEHGFDRARIVELPLFALQPASVALDGRQANQLLFVGQLIRGKGLDVLLSALAKVRKEVELLVVGSGRQEQQFRRQAEKLGIAGRVSFLGQLPQEEISRYYLTATVVVVPSRYPETFGLVGVEAMSHGAPVIATRVGAIGEWLLHEETGLAVEPNDPDALAAAIERLLGSPRLRRQLAARGEQRYRENFTPERHLQALCGAIEQVLTERRHEEAVR